MEGSLSVVIPFYNAHRHLSSLKRSFEKTTVPQDKLEIIFVDDGSIPPLVIDSFCGFPYRVITHPKNLGMCAARNSGIAASSHEWITILDADDEFISNWWKVFQSLIVEIPSECNVIFSKCVNQFGAPTVSRPDYEGYLTYENLLQESTPGEYLPIFRREYIQKALYSDLGTTKSCGIISYLRFAKEAPFWISPRSIRLYNVANPGSVTDRRMNPDSIAETVKCYERLIIEFGEDYVRYAPQQYGIKRIKSALYRRLLGDSSAWKEYLSAWGYAPILWLFGGFFGLILGNRMTRFIDFSKKYLVIRRYG